MTRAKKLKGAALLEYLLIVSRRMAEIRNLDNLLTYAVDEVMQLVGAERGYIVLNNGDGGFDFRIMRKVKKTKRKDFTRNKISFHPYFPRRPS